MQSSCKTRKNRFAFVLLILVALLLGGCGAFKHPPAGNKTTSLVILSDVHFTPFYDPAIFPALVASRACKWGDIFQTSNVVEPLSWGNETNYPLLVKALNAARREAGSCSLAIFPGDILAHRFRETFFRAYGKKDEEVLRSFVHKTVVFFANEARQRFGEIPVVFQLGNNDSYAGDYQLVSGGQFLADTADDFYRIFLLERADAQSYLETYRAGGYYVTEPVGSDLRIISLNTVLFSVRRTAGFADSSDAIASQQLEWLDQSLAKARRENKRVWLLMHIPPGADVFSTVNRLMDPTGHIADAAVLWKEPYQERFLRIVRRYEDIIQAAFAGHTHMDEYRLWNRTSEDSGKAIIVTPSVSPIFGNDPAFKIVTVSIVDWHLLDYRSFSYPLGAAGNFRAYYDFSGAYGISPPLQEGFADLYPLLNADPSKRKAYERFYYSGHDSADNITVANWPAYWCGIGNLVKQEFMECVNAAH